MTKRSFRRYLLLLGASLLIFFLFTQTHIFIVVSGDSMLPSLVDGEIVVSSRRTTITPGDVYLVQEPDGTIKAIKRLIGIPGDHIALVDGATYRNGTLIMDATGDSWDNMEWDLGPDEYLFIGDNRGVSYDGRFWSRCVKLEEILYHLDYTIYPFTSLGKVKGLP